MLRERIYNPLVFYFLIFLKFIHRLFRVVCGILDFTGISYFYSTHSDWEGERGKSLGAEGA